MWSAACLLACPLGQVVRLFVASGPAGRLAQVLWSCVPCFSSAFLLCSRCVACKYGSISHSKGVLTGFCGCCVCLYWLRALRGLWGFCVREWLGGLRACGVFALRFLLLLLCLPPFMLVVLLCSGCLSFVLLHCLCGSLGVVVVSFSLTDYTQKERAQFLASSLVLL